MAVERWQFLDSTLSKTIDMVKFAEAKHAVLIGLVGASIFGFVRLILAVDSIGVFVSAYAVQFLVLASAALVISLLSFVPVLHASVTNSDSHDTGRLNLLFFCHAASFDAAAYLRQVDEALVTSSGDTPQINQMAAGEIVINARIAMFKFSMFRYALMCFLSAMLTPVIAVIAWKLTRHRVAGVFRTEPSTRS